MPVAGYSSSYKAWAESSGFEARAGFALSALQVQDVESFVNMERSCNFYEVGGGKTVVATAVALMRGKQQKLVVVPPILISPWVTWLTKVSDGVLMYKGEPKERRTMDVRGAHWIVMSQAIFRGDFKRLQVELSDSLEIIIDEAQAIKNPQSVLFKCLQRLVG